EHEAKPHEGKPLANGDLEVAYTCSGVKDHDSCKDSLHKACGSDALKATATKCTPSNDQAPKPAPKDDKKPEEHKPEGHSAKPVEHKPEGHSAKPEEH
ncbi:unnamed protein product, partial [Adineta steineri]